MKTNDILNQQRRIILNKWENKNGKRFDDLYWVGFHVYFQIEWKKSNTSNILGVWINIL